MTSPHNPYEARAINPSESANVGTRLREPLPRGLTIYAVLFIIFGALGCVTLPGFIVATAIQTFVPQPTGESPEIVFQQKMKGIGDSVFWPSLVLAVVDTGIGIAFVVSGINTLRRKLSSLKLGVLACQISLIVEVFRTGFGAYAAYLQYEVVDTLPMDQIKNSPAGPFIETMFAYMPMISICGVSFMAILRFLYYGFGWSIYAKSKNVEYLS